MSSSPSRPSSPPPPPCPVASVAAAWTMLDRAYPEPKPGWLTRALQMRNHPDRTETDRALLTFAVCTAVAFLVEMENVAGVGGDGGVAVRIAQSLAAKAKAGVRRAQQRDALLQSMESNAMQIYALWCPEDAERMVQQEQAADEGEETGADMQ